MNQNSGELTQADRKGLLASIPAFPPIVLRLLDLLARDDVEIRELVALISSDPAFSAQILRVANSPLFGFRSQIDSLQSALVVLGLRRVRSISMTVATANHMKGVLQIEELAGCGKSKARIWAGIIDKPPASGPSTGACRRMPRSSPPAITTRKAAPQWTCSPWCTWGADWRIAWASGWSSR